MKITKTTLERKNLWLGVAFVLAAGILIGTFLHSVTSTTTVGGDFKELSLKEMRERYIQERAYAIELAEKQGLYDCCIDPPCTMCFDRGIGHEWSRDGQYCSCDKLLEEGKDPCPQCKAGLAQGLGEPPGK